MQSTIRKALPAALSVALVAGALAVPAIATTDDADDEATTSTTPDDAPVRERLHRHPVAHAALHGLEEGELAERLADELGLDTETVQDAIDAVRDDLAAERLAEAVESGRLTQEQADRIAEAAADGTLDEVLPEIRLEHLADRLAERVEAGELTQEEADDILEDAEAGDWPLRDRIRDRVRDGHGPHGPGGPGGAPGGEDTSL